MASPSKNLVPPTGTTTRCLVSSVEMSVKTQTWRSCYAAWPVGFNPLLSRFLFVVGKTAPVNMTPVKMLLPPIGLVSRRASTKVITTFPGIYLSNPSRPYFGQLWPRGVPPGVS